MRALLAVAMLAVTSLVGSAAHADPSPDDPPRLAVVLPVAVAEPVDVDRDSLDALLEESARDLGLSVAVPPEKIHRDEARLPAQARELDRLVIVPTLRRRGARIEIRIVMASPTGTVLQSRVERTAPELSLIHI